MTPRSLFSRLLATHLIVAVAALGVLGFAADRFFERRALDTLRDRLAAEAASVRSAVASTGALLQERVRALGTASGTRLTIIRSDGVVLADSERDPATMEDHGERPEVRTALAGRIGTAQRRSETIGRPYLYVALPIRDGTVVRAALDASYIEAQRDDVRRAVLLSFLATGAAAAVIAAVLARTVSRPLERIGDEVGRVARGEFGPLELSGPREARSLATAVNAMATDLASRVEDIRRETALRDQILSTMEDGVVLAGRDGRVLYANAAAGRLLAAGGPRELPPNLREPGVAEFTVHYPRSRDLRATTVALKDRLLVVVRDVTETRRIEAVRRDFVANASHELKTPVSAIRATAETLEDALREDPERVPGFATTLAREAERLSQLVEDLLDLSRLEQGPGLRAPVPLGLVVRREAAAAEPIATAKKLALDVSVDDTVVVLGSEEDLALLVRNLLDNAIRYTPAGTVSVRLAADGGRAILAVTDTGIGIPSGELPRIFERFYRVDKARSRATGGTGLGLSLVRHVAESHGGRVRAESELGAGSTFTVSLPAG